MRNLTIILLIITSAILSINAQDDDIKVKISSERTNVEVDEAFQINLEIIGTSGNISIEDMGEIDSSIFIRQSGTMSNISIINGAMTSSLTIGFYVKISKPGSYSLGPFVLNIKDEKYKTDVIDINVTTQTGQNVSTAHAYNGYNESPENSNNQSYLLELNANKNEVYINEPIDVSVNFFMSIDAKLKNYQPLSFPTAAWIERYATEDNCKGKIRKNNKTYVEYELEKERIFITKPGIYTINPAVFEFYGIKPSNIFSTYEPMVLKTEPLEIEVIPLPENAPQGFNDAVGTFEVTSSISSLNLNTKESATLEISLIGDGNFQNIKDISYKVDNSVEVYSSNSKLESEKNSKKKIWEILLVPSVPGKHVIKIEDFHYFDTNRKKYITIKGNEYTLNVAGNTKTNFAEKTTIPTRNEKKSKENIQIANFSNINYLQLTPGINNKLFNYELWYRFIIIMYLMIFLLLASFIIFKYMIFNSLKKSHIIESKNAYKDFVHNINSLKKDINNMHCQKCTDRVSNILEKYFIKKFSICSVEFTKKGIEKKLSDHLSEGNINNLKEIIIKLDMIRFGGEEISLDNSKNLLDTIREYVRKIEHNNKK